MSYWAVGGWVERSAVLTVPFSLGPCLLGIVFMAACEHGAHHQRFDGWPFLRYADLADDAFAVGFGEATGHDCFPIS